MTELLMITSRTYVKLTEHEYNIIKKLQILNIRDKHVFYHKIPIQVITLDSFIEKHNIQNIDSWVGLKIEILICHFRCQISQNFLTFSFFSECFQQSEVSRNYDKIM